MYDKHFLHTLDVWICMIIIFVVWNCMISIFGVWRSTRVAASSIEQIEISENENFFGIADYKEPIFFCKCQNFNAIDHTLAL